MTSYNPHVFTQVSLFLVNLIVSGIYKFQAIVRSIENVAPSTLLFNNYSFSVICITRLILVCFNVFSLCVCMFCLHVCLCTNICAWFPFVDQKRISDPLAQLQIVVSNHMVLGIEPMSVTKATSTISHWDISLAPCDPLLMNKIWPKLGVVLS